MNAIRLLVLYRRGSLEVDRWETADAELASRLDAAAAELARLPAEPVRAVFERDHARLSGMADIAAAIAHDPSLARRVLVALEADVQMTADGPVVRWPDWVAALIGAVT